MTYRQRVENLPAELDGAIDDAMVDAEERGIIEDEDSDRFWQAVYEQVTA
jgi:hypothetical protein